MTKGLETQTGVKGLSAFAQNKIAERDALNAMRSSGAYNIGMFVGNTLSTIQYATSSAFNVTTTYLNAYSGGQLGNIAPDLFKINSAKDLMAENSRALSRSQSTAFHVAREWYRNRDVIDTAVTVAAVATSAITAGGSLAALAAYNAIEGAFDGGTMGAIAGAVSALASETGVSLDYTFEDGWSGSVGIKAGDFLTLSGGYSEENGWGAQAGIVVGDMNFGVGGTEGTGVNASIGFGFVENMNGNNMVNAGITFNENDGPGVSLTGNSDVGESWYSGNVSGGLTFTQRTGLGITGGYNVAGLPPLFNNTGATFNYNSIDQGSVSLNYQGANAFNWTNQTGVTGNQNFGVEYYLARVRNQQIAAQQSGNLGRDTFGLNAIGDTLTAIGQNFIDQVSSVFPGSEATQRQNEAQSRTMADNVGAVGWRTTRDEEDLLWSMVGVTGTNGQEDPLTRIATENPVLSRLTDEQRAQLLEIYTLGVAADATAFLNQAGLTESEVTSAVNSLRGGWKALGVTGQQEMREYYNSVRSDRVYGVDQGYTNPLNAEVVETLNHPGSNTTAGGYPDRPGSVNIVSGNFISNPSFWDSVKNFVNDLHYTPDNDDTTKVDLGNRYANQEAAWYGPNANFRVDNVNVGDPIWGSNVELTVLNADGTERGKVRMVHMTQINKAVLDAFTNKTSLQGGTYLGNTNFTIGNSSGPHLHIQDISTNESQQGRRNIYNMMRGK